MPRQGDEASGVRNFWFVQCRPRQWFRKDPAFDALHRKPRGGSDRKVVEYTRIERGQTA